MSSAFSICVSVLLAFSSTFAVSASVAAAETAIVDKSMAEHTDSYELSLPYPEVGIAAVDSAIHDFVQATYTDFKGWAARRSPQEPPYFAELTYSVARNDESMLSILFKYSYFTGGVHPNLNQTAFNFLMPDGARVFLPELVGGEGVKRVSAIAIGDLDARLTNMSDPNWIRTGAGPYADNFDVFQWLPDEVVLNFDPYQVAAYVVGPQEVHIPLDQLQDVLRPDPRVPLPSFDCAAAETAVEHAICSDMQLAQLDRRTAEAFNMRLRLEAIGNEPPTVRAQQQAWLGQRDAACAASTSQALVSCLSDQYTQRLQTLRSFN